MGRRIAIALLVVAGCSDDAPSIKLADLRAESTRVRCDYLVRCGQFADADTCTNFFRIRDERALIAAVDAGKIHYDGAAALRCQDALATLSCDLSSRDARVLPAACDQMLRGTLAAGAACQLDLECKSGDCDRPVCSLGECCPGSCLAIERRPVGAACETDAGCAAETFCGEDHLCRALALAGEACRADTHCDYGLGCIGATELDAGACRAMPLIGERCPYLRCAELGARCDSSKNCVAVGLAGAPCTGDADCSPYALCGPSSTCIDVPQRGMACTVSCAGEAWCDANVCSPPQEDTAPCTSDNQCASLYCAEGMFFDQCATGPVCI